MRTVLIALVTAVVVTSTSYAQEHTSEWKMANAMSAAPASVSGAAAIMDWDHTVLRPGSNGWTCLPDMPETPGNDPMCLDAPWLAWAEAYMGKTTPSITHMGFGYMLAGDSPASNTDPFAEGPTATNEWMEHGGPHLMIVVSDAAQLTGLSHDPTTGGPWVMWRDTPYAHIMVPVPSPEMRH
ncbi:MAG TPA: hypothetical protein VGA37_16595 [Gemmatimonadales bacterium]